MQSNSLHHYPQITYRGEEKLLWNPVSKKSFKNLPEERVRLRLVEFLIEEARFSKNRIAFESPVFLPKDKTKSRTDLICYNNDFKPLLLVECKAPEVRLDAKVALQIARYNQQIDAPFLLVTNGIKEFWFSQKEDVLSFLNTIPEPFNVSNPLEQTFEYWSQRGFAGKNSPPETRNWILKSCSELYQSEQIPSQYFSFEGTSPDLGLPNYYQIYPVSEHTKIALALSSKLLLALLSLTLYLILMEKISGFYPPL
ncbi:MAG: hypothetical protein BalsKO_26900 [Balneolaceae bacterium]